MFSFLSRLFSRKPRYCESLKRFPQQLVRDLPITPEIERALEVTRKARPNLGRRVMEEAEENYKIHYHYDGRWLAFTDTPEGISVLASSLDEASDFLLKLTDEERSYVCLMVAGEWDYELSPEPKPHETQDQAHPMEANGDRLSPTGIQNGSAHDAGLPTNEVRS